MDEIKRATCKRHLGKEIDCSLTQHANYVYRISYVAHHNKIYFGTACGASVLICPHIKCYGSYYEASKAGTGGRSSFDRLTVLSRLSRLFKMRRDKYNLVSLLETRRD